MYLSGEETATTHHSDLQTKTTWAADGDSPRSQEVPRYYYSSSPTGPPGGLADGAKFRGEVSQTANENGSSGPGMSGTMNT
jgi:hypothetical protein